jgi:hydroxyacylglutathione hydrolase
MSIEIVTIPCLTDNYAFLLHNSETGKTALIDIPEAAPILAALAARQWTLSDIIITHHHDDHIQGIAAILAVHKARVIGAKADAHRLPPLDLQITEGEVVNIVGADMHIIDVPGHTVGHLAFYFPALKAVFTADSLMAMGCGRLFEGTPAQMWDSLSKIAALPSDTIVYSGHEYTTSNARFAMTIEPNNPDLIQRVADIATARAAGIPTVPSALALELATNPFLRAHLPEVKAAIGMEGATDVAVFTEIRERKNRF